MTISNIELMYIDPGGGGGGGYSGYKLVGVCPGTPKREVLGAGTAPKMGGLRCGHNQKKGGLRHIYNPKKGGI